MQPDFEPSGAEEVETAMLPCDCCGNVYDKAFQVKRDGETFTFDCIECAAHVLAPVCTRCGCRVLGHGVEDDGAIFCCASCARRLGKTGIRDRADRDDPSEGEEAPAPRHA